MNKLRDIINSLNYRELKLIEKDLYEGNIGRLIKQRLQEFEQTTDRICPTCGQKVDENSKFVLIFGPSDLRKKAMFDEIDCLLFFLQKIQKIKN